MSLVQRIETAQVSPEAALASRDPAATSGPTSALPSLSLLRRVQVESRFRREPVLPASPQLVVKDPVVAPKLTTAHSVAIGLIDEVANILPTLVRENEMLRSKLETAEAKAETDLENATLIACEWRRSAETAKLRADNLETKLKDLTDRLQSAEAKLVSQNEAAQNADKKAAEAECLSSLFEEKLLSSFGVGSQLQSALDKIRSRDFISID